MIYDAVSKKGQCISTKDIFCITLTSILFHKEIQTCGEAISMCAF
jgi:hypothetical protein